MSRLTLLCVLVVAASHASAQRRWIVDAQNGPGTDFTDLPPAIAAAADGDMVLARPGLYSGFTTGKGLRVVAPQGGATLYPTATGGHNLIVQGVPAGRTFVLHGFAGLARMPLYADLVGNAGLVVLSSVAAVETCGCGPLHQNPPGIEIVDCAQVVLDGCTNYGGPAVRCVRSHVTITRCNLGFVSASDPMGDCLHVDGGEVELVESVLDARAGYTVNVEPKPAIRLLGGTLRLRGTAAALVQGAWELTPTAPAPAILATGGVLVRDPDVRLNPDASLGSPVVNQGALVTTRQLSAALVRSLGIGATLQAELIAAPGASCVLLLGNPLPPALSSIGTLELDPRLVVPIASGVVGPAGSLTATLAVPAGVPLGVALAVQGAGDLGSGLELSSAAIAVTR